MGTKKLGTEAWAKAWRLPAGPKDHQKRKRRQKRIEKRELTRQIKEES